MDLAHGTSEGPHLEYLATALALVVLGVTFEIQRNVQRIVSVGLIVAGALLGAAALVV